jgi:antitoxin component YwqK of YwqJK toxin-antitoxin module
MRLTSLILLFGLIGAGLKLAGDESGELSGERTTCWPNGSPREEATYSEGLRDGHCQRWHADGTPRAEGLYSAGKMIAEWRFYDPSGALDLARSGQYERGERVSPLNS